MREACAKELDDRAAIAQSVEIHALRRGERIPAERANAAAFSLARAARAIREIDAELEAATGAGEQR